MTGTFLNVGTVLLGSSVGLVLGGRLPERVRETVLMGLGLLTVVIGIQMALKTTNILILLGSTLLGGVVGEGLNIQGGLDRLGAALQARFPGRGEGRFSEGFITASLVFCVGPMTVLGSIQDGLSGNYQLLAVKSTLDGFASLAFAAAFGPGVLFAALTVLFFQGGISLGAGSLQGVLTPPMVDEMTAAGGVMVLGIGLVILDVVQPRVANYLPALAIAPSLVAVVRLM
jgi:uncharacterized membrane protein YqgA involved in biofilm formation